MARAVRNVRLWPSGHAKVHLTTFGFRTCSQVRKRTAIASVALSGHPDHKADVRFLE